MHLRLDAAPAVVSAPSSPERPSKVFGRTQGVVSRRAFVRHWSEDNGERSGGDALPGLRVLAGRDDSVGATLGDRIMAFAGVVGTVGGHRADLFAKRYLVEQIGQDRCVADMAPGDLDSADLQRFLIDSKMNLAPDPQLGTTVLAGVPLAFPRPGSGWSRVKQPAHPQPRLAERLKIRASGTASAISSSPRRIAIPMQRGCRAAVSQVWRRLDAAHAISGS